MIEENPPVNWSDDVAPGLKQLLEMVENFTSREEITVSVADMRATLEEIERLQSEMILLEKQRDIIVDRVVAALDFMANRERFVMMGAMSMSLVERILKGETKP